MEQGFQLSQWMLHALERQGNTIYYVKGEVRSANPAEFKELEARLGLKVGGKELKLHWEAANGGRDFNFTSDTFNRPPHLSRIELITRGDNFFIPAELGKEILFNEKEPGILQWRMFFGEENYLWLAFSEPSIRSKTSMVWFYSMESLPDVSKFAKISCSVISIVILRVVAE